MQKLKKLITGLMLVIISTLVFSANGVGGMLNHEENHWMPTAHAEGEDAECGEAGWDPIKEECYPATDFDGILKNIDPVENTPDDAKTTKEILDEVAKSATKAHRFFAPMINFLSFQIGNFLGNDYIYQGAMGDMLKKIWVMSRNLVNIFFVFFLLFLAVKTIFWPESSLDDLKKNLVKFVLLLVAVNFSWLGTKVVLDAANVTTYVVFAIPSGISDPPQYKAQVESGEECKVNTNDKSPITGQCYPTKIFAPIDGVPKPILYWQDNGKASEEEQDDDHCGQVEEIYEALYDEEGKPKKTDNADYERLRGRTSMCMSNLNISKYDQNTATIYMTYGMARIQNVINASASGGDGASLAVGTLMSILIQTVYTIALFALFITLIVRMIMLWILVAFSPFLALTLIFTGENAASKYFSLEQFISWAFAPAKVGVVFVIAFMMISAGQSMGNISISAVDNLLKNSGFTFKLIGQESLFAGVDSLQQFIWLLATVAVLWLGVFAVLSKLTVVGNWFSNIGEQGKEYAIQAAKAPYLAPILPLGPDGKRSSIKKALYTNLGIDKLKEGYQTDGNGGFGTGNDRLNRRMRQADYSEIESLVDNRDYTPQKWNDFVRNRIGGYSNLRNMMNTETEQDIKAGLLKMKGIDGNTRKANLAYEAMVKANGGNRAKQVETQDNPPGTAPAPSTPPATAPARATTSSTSSTGATTAQNPNIDAAGQPDPNERQGEQGQDQGGVSSSGNPVNSGDGEDGEAAGVDSENQPGSNRDDQDGDGITNSR